MGERVAFLGLGVMGAPMAGHLARAGHDVTVYNRTVSRAEAWVREHGGRLVNLDATVVLERPRLASHIAAIRAALAEALGCEQGQVSVKAKTAEGFGAVGEGRAIEARAVVLIELP